ncbi:MAG: DUF502 domain-containing protein [Candidatus Omnitrophota bacterium]
MKKIEKYFITGLIVLIPLFLTIYLLVFMFYFFDGIFGKFINSYLKYKMGFYIPGLGIVIVLLLVFSVGILASWFFSKKIFSKIEKLFIKLPLIRNIYPAFKQLVLFLFSRNEFGFQKVVLVEYPSKGIWAIGFLTNEQIKVIKDLDKEIVAVFVPSSPGPLSGYTIFVPKNELKFPNISVTDALKIIISGGVLKQEGPYCQR